LLKDCTVRIDDAVNKAELEEGTLSDALGLAVSWCVVLAQTTFPILELQVEGIALMPRSRQLLMYGTSD